MIGATVALLLSLQAAGAPQAPTVQPPPRPGMVYSDITGHYLPIIGWRPSSSEAREVQRGVKLQRRSVARKIGEAPIGR